MDASADAAKAKYLDHVIPAGIAATVYDIVGQTSLSSVSNDTDSHESDNMSNGE